MVHIELTLPQFTLQLSFLSVIVYIPFEHHNFYHGCYDPQQEAQLFLIAYHYFDATLADMTSSVRLVGFTPQHQIQLN